MDYIVTGKIKTSYGVEGYLKVISYSGLWSHFFDLKEVTLINKEVSLILEIEDVKKHGDEILIKFLGINTPEEARKYNGFDIAVDRKKAAPLEKGEFYLSDLIDLEITFNDVKLGRVLSFFTNTAQTTLEVLMYKDNTKKLLLLIDEFIENIDFDKKIIKINNDWILE